MDNGFHIMKAGQSTSKYQNVAGEFSLVASQGNMEAYVSKINKGKSVLFLPSESKDSFNVFYVTEGKFFHTNTQTYLYPGDIVAFSNLTEVQHLSVLEPSTMFRVNSKIMFVEQAESVHNMTMIMDKIQYKDNYTEKHCNQTGNLACQIGVVLKAPEEVIHTVAFGSKIHDVGKINVEDFILNKKSSLTEAEFNEVKKHTIDGYHMVMEHLNNESFAILVRDHHERLDGSGYPNGLKGDEISLEARILAVADAFDAMTSDRPYRCAMSPKEALQELSLDSGVKYDSQVIDALRTVLSFA